MPDFAESYQRRKRVAVATELNAIPHVLSRVGTELITHGQTLHDTQRSCQREADSAQQGWVGSSAVALAGLLDQWSGAAAGQLADIGTNAANLQAAARGFLEMEQHNAGSLR